MKTRAALGNGAWLAASLPAWHRYGRALEHPDQTQRKILARLIARNTASAYGRAHGFQEISSYNQFRERVPIVSYEDLEPWITRIMHGEPAILTQEPVTRLVPTSGSTGGRKLIPFTAALQREFNAAVGPWMVDLARRYPSVPLGPAYWSISPAMPVAADEDSAIPIGFDDDSAYLGGIRKKLVESAFAVPSALRLVGDLDASRYATLLCLLRQPELRLISVWHPSFLALLLDALPPCWDELLVDVASGECPRLAAFPEEFRRVLRAPPQPARACALGHAGPSNLSDLWPHLRVVSCWGDGHATLPLAELQRRLPHAVVQPKGLLATEAFVSIPFAGQHPLAVTSHFFEFADARGNTRLSHELQTGESYAVIVTNAGGLWRYRLGDLVEVDGFVAATPSLRFLGREGGVSDLCGEKLAESFVTQAIQAVCASLHFAPRFAMLAPDAGPDAHWFYALFVEGESPHELPARLEEALRKNPHYALARDLGQLGPVHCCETAEGAYDLFCQVGASEGRRLGDIKPQALSARTDWRNHLAGLTPQT